MGVDTPGVARTFYYTDEASRLFTDTTQKIDTQRFQVAAVMGTSVPGLPVRDCAESCKSSVPRCAKMSTVDVMNKTIFEHLYLVQGLGTLYLRVKCPYVLAAEFSNKLTAEFPHTCQKSGRSKGRSKGPFKGQEQARTGQTFV